MTTWPYQTLGVTAQYQASDSLLVSVAAYDHGRDVGQYWVTTTNRGMFYISQADIQPFVNDDQGLLTLIRVGSWHQTSDSLANDGNSVFSDIYGFYATADQMLFTEPPDATQGLGGFATYSWAPADRNQIDVHYSAGLVYRGLIPDRDQDTIGVGFTLVEFSRDVRLQTGQTTENAIELFYKARPFDWLTVQPDLQSILRPNGVERDALAAGLRFDINF